MTTKRWLVKKGDATLYAEPESEPKHALTQDSDLTIVKMALMRAQELPDEESRVLTEMKQCSTDDGDALMNSKGAVDEDGNMGGSLSTPPSTAPSTPRSRARQEILLMTGQQTIAGAIPPSSDGSSVENLEMDSDSESFTKDEQLNIQMELRESKESGYDAFNDDTFGSDWVGASKDWTFEENVLANERLAGSEFLSQSEAGKTQRKAKAGKENATPRPHSQKFTDGCRNCGHHHQSAAKFCIICGAKREVKAPVVVTPRILAPSAVYTADSRHNIGTCGHRAPTAVYTADSGHNIATYAVSPSPAPVTAPPGNLLDKQPAEPPFQSWAPQAVQAPTIAEGFNFATKDPLKVCVLESIKTSVMAKPLHPEFPAKKMVPSYVQHPATTVLQDLQALCESHAAQSRYNPPELDRNHQPCIQQ